jgi:hypothetical protein
MIEKLRALYEAYPERMTAITVLWLTTFLSLWASYEGWRFGVIWGRWPCTKRQAQVLALVSLLTAIVGLWLAGPIKIPPP